VGSPDVAGTLVFLAAELLLLGIWTALFDPKLPFRWLSITAIIAVAGVIFAADFDLLFRVFYSDIGFWVGYRYITVVVSSIAFVSSAFIVVLLIHCLLWLPRAYLGLRLCFGEDAPELPRRQFGTWQALLWIGLVGALFGVGRAVSGQDWFLPAVVTAALATILAAALAVPTFWVVLRRSRSWWKFLGLFFMTSACLIVLCFNLALVGVIWLNAWTLSLLGVRLVMATRPMTSSTAAFSVSSIQ